MLWHFNTQVKPISLEHNHIRASRLCNCVIIGPQADETANPSHERSEIKIHLFTFKKKDNFTSRKNLFSRFITFSRNFLLFLTRFPWVTRTDQRLGNSFLYFLAKSRTIHLRHLSAATSTWNKLSRTISGFMGNAQVHLARKLLGSNDWKGENKTVIKRIWPLKEEKTGL